jgi:uncharacterized surface protein with fasciclin (FAS1) repeats
MKQTLIATAVLALLMSTACTAKQGDAATEDAAAPPAMASTAEAAPQDAMPATGAAMPRGNPMVGGAPMMADKDIIDNAMNSKDHTTLVAAVKAAGLVDTLKGPGPFTVFAPTNEAFDALPSGTVDKLLKPDMKADLTEVLTYHVVSGNLDAATLTQQVQAGGGSARLKTVQGEELVAKADGGKVTVTDAKGNVANVTIADVRQSNGVIHVVDKVLMP